MVSPKVQAELDQVLPDDFPDLGALQEVHSGFGGSPLEYVFSGLGFLVFAALCLAGILLIKTDNPGDAPFKNGILGVMCAGCAGTGLVAVALGLRNRGRRFKYGKHWLICEGGLVTVFQGKPKGYRWEQVFVWLDIVIPENRVGVLINHTYTLRAGKKRQEVPMPMKGKGPMARKFARALQKRHVEAVLPDFVARVDAGEPTPMGLFLFSKGGFAIGGQNWLWDEVKKFDFDYDMNNACIRLTITGRGRHTQKLELSSEMPNLWLFFNAVREFCPRAVKEQTRADRFLS